MFHNIVSFHGDELTAHRPTPKLHYHPSSAIRNNLFNIFAATFHICRASELHIGFWWGDRGEGDHLVDPGVDGRIILK